MAIRDFKGELDRSHGAFNRAKEAVFGTGPHIPAREVPAIDETVGPLSSMEMTRAIRERNNANGVTIGPDNPNYPAIDLTDNPIPGPR